MALSSEKSSYLGTMPIPRLLLKQSLPAAIGFMVMSLNMVVDTFFVGQYIGGLAIGAISVTFPISFYFPQLVCLLELVEEVLYQGHWDVIKRKSSISF